MKLYLYDVKSSSYKMLEDSGGKIYNVVSHMNTLVSLKAIGEENTKTLESAECAIGGCKRHGLADKAAVGGKRSDSGLHTIWLFAQLDSQAIGLYCHYIWMHYYVTLMDAGVSLMKHAASVTVGLGDKAKPSTLNPMGLEDSMMEHENGLRPPEHGKYVSYKSLC
ncbi:hypothetical protein C5167_026345 [Papaver somniferum]|nr:hypothetical protein C5167_026345 [Papaver somniferum]